jgi:hypothetical protein
VERLGTWLALAALTAGALAVVVWAVLNGGAGGG